MTNKDNHGVGLGSQDAETEGFLGIGDGPRRSRDREELLMAAIRPETPEVTGDTTERPDEVIVGRLGGTEPVREQSFGSWWTGLTNRLISQTIPKMDEYGDRDLYEIGRALRLKMGRSEDRREGGGVADDRFDYSAGVWFYLTGKLARWSSAIDAGRLPSKDTLDDIIVYATMARHDMDKDQD